MTDIILGATGDPIHHQRQQNTYRWATVASLNPLRITLDGETVPLPITPDCLARGLAVGTRVWVQMWSRQVLVLGATASVVPAPEYASFGFQDSWFEYGGGFGPSRMVKTADGLVTVEGIFKHAGKAMTANVAYNVATVPVGFRPAAQTLTSGNTQYQACRVDVYPNGNVTFNPMTAVTATYMSFAGQSWMAAPT